MIRPMLAMPLLLFLVTHAGAAWAQQDAPAPAQPAVEAPAPEAAEAARRRQEAAMDLDMLIEQVAMATGKQFLVDPRVRARVYNVPRIESPTYDTLLSILRINGFMAVEIGGRINVLPDGLARSLPVRLLQRDDANVPDDEWVTRVVTVRNGNAAQLVPILRPLMPQAAHMAATGDGKLVLVDTYANIRRLTQVIEALTQ